MATYDTGSFNKLTSGGSPFTISVTVASQPNRVLLVLLSGVSGAVSSITYNGVALTQLFYQSNSSNGLNDGAFYLVAPATGANNLVVTLTSTRDVACSIFSVYNADQSSPIDNYSTQVVDSNTAHTTFSSSLTTNFNNAIIFDLFTTLQNPRTLTPGGSQTQVGSTLTLIGTGSSAGASYRVATTAGSFTNSWSWVTSGAASYFGAIVAIKDKQPINLTLAISPANYTLALEPVALPKALTRVISTTNYTLSLLNIILTKFHKFTQDTRNTGSLTADSRSANATFNQDTKNSSTFIPDNRN